MDCVNLFRLRKSCFSAEGKLELTEQTNREELREEWAHLGKIQKFMYEKGIKNERLLLMDCYSVL